VCFSEDQAQYALAVDNAGLDVLRSLAQKHNQRFRNFGSFGGKDISLKSRGQLKVSLPLATLRAAHEGWLPKYMRGEA